MQGLEETPAEPAGQGGGKGPVWWERREVLAVDDGVDGEARVRVREAGAQATDPAATCPSRPAPCASCASVGLAGRTPYLRLPG